MHHSHAPLRQCSGLIPRFSQLLSNIRRAYHNHTWGDWIVSATHDIFLFFGWVLFVVPKRCLEKHDDVIKWKHFPRNWPFVRGIHRSPVNFPHKGQWRGALMFTLICARINGWVNTREAGDLRRYRPHYDVIVMKLHHLMLGHLQ